MRRLKSTLTSRFYKRKVDITVFNTLPLEDQLVSPMEQLHFLIGYSLLRPTLRARFFSKLKNNHILCTVYENRIKDRLYMDGKSNIFLSVETSCIVRSANN